MDEKLQLQRETIYELDKRIPGMLDNIKSNIFDSGYFKKIGFAKRIYNYFGYDLSENLYDEFLSRGIKKTHLGFEAVQEFLDDGEDKAEFYLKIFNEGREFIDNLLVAEKIYH